jgi:folate-dependent phosphoribosylglycinamide formyltransferase PurN
MTEQPSTEEPVTARVTPARRVRVYVAAAPDAPITDAALTALVRNPAVELVGIDYGRIDPARLREAAPDLLLSAAHRHLLRAPELAVARLGSVGLHPALLPAYRGSHPLWWALRNGEREAGLTLYVLDTGIDTGPILDQRSVPIVPGDTFATLYRRTVEHVGPMLDALIAGILERGRLPDAMPQDESMASVYAAPTERELHGTLAGRIVRKAGRAIRRGVERVRPAASRDGAR